MTNSRIIEKIYESINDLKEVYVKELGQIPKWPEYEILFFQLNCDANITFMYDKELEIHPDSKSHGLTRGLYEILSFISSYHGITGDMDFINTDYSKKTSYYNDLYETAYIFLTCGPKNAY